FRNHSMWGRSPKPPPKDAVALDVGSYDARLGLSMGELAARSRSQHKSQGFGVAEQRGENIEYFVPLAGRPATKDMFAGLDLGWTRYGAAAKPYVRAIASAQRVLDRDHPERALPALVAARRELDKLPDDARVRDARQAFDELLASAAGLYARATAAAPTAVPGANVEVTLELVARGAPVTVRRVEVGSVAPITKSTAIARAEKKLGTAAVTLRAKTSPSVAYWLAQPAQPGHYKVADQRDVGAPLGAPPPSATIDLVIGGRAVRLARPAGRAVSAPAPGARVRPLPVARPS